MKIDFPFMVKFVWYKSSHFTSRLSKSLLDDFTLVFEIYANYFILKGSDNLIYFPLGSIWMSHKKCFKLFSFESSSSKSIYSSHFVAFNFFFWIGNQPIYKTHTNSGQSIRPICFIFGKIFFLQITNYDPKYICAHFQQRWRISMLSSFDYILWLYILVVTYTNA